MLKGKFGKVGREGNSLINIRGHNSLLKMKGWVAW